MTDGEASSSSAMNLVKSCIIEYDGASKDKNPARTGGGVVIRGSDDITMIIRERFGTDFDHPTDDAYLALQRGLQTALGLGYQSVTIRGDSELVHMHMSGQPETRDQDRRYVHNLMDDLKGRFSSFTSELVPTEYNREVDALANEGADLKVGEVEMLFG